MSSTAPPLDWTRLVTPGHTWTARLRRLTPIPLALGLALIASGAWVISDSTVGLAQRLTEAQASTDYSFAERLRVAPLATLTGTNILEARNPFAGFATPNWTAVQVTFGGDADALLSVEEYAEEVALNLRALAANGDLPTQACSAWTGRPGGTPTPLVCRKADDAVFVFGSITTGRTFLHTPTAQLLGVYYRSGDMWAYANIDAPGFQALRGFETVQPQFIPAAMAEAFPELLTETTER